MKETVVVLANTTGERWPELQELFRRINRPDLAAGPKRDFGYVLELSPDAFAAFAGAADALGLSANYSFRWERTYTDRELAAAPLVWPWLNRRERGLSAVMVGVTYDLSAACPNCASGAVQVSPLRLTPSELRGTVPMNQTINLDFVVSTAVAKELREAGVSGLELRQVFSRVDGAALPWWQLIASQHLLPMSSVTRGFTRDRPCPTCRRNGFFFAVAEPLEIVYEADPLDPSTVPDVAYTWEHFGYSMIRTPFERSHLARPKLVMKPTVMAILRRHRIRGLSFLPIRIGVTDPRAETSV